MEQQQAKDYMSWKIDSEQVTLGTELGRGAFAVVYRGEWQGMEVAVKKFDSDSPDPNDSYLQQWVPLLRDRIRLQHPNIVQFLGAAITPGSFPLLVLELLPASLKEVLVTTTAAPAPPSPESGGAPAAPAAIPLTFREKLDLACDIARGLTHLHCHDMTHGDVTSANILVSSDMGGKVADLTEALIKQRLRLAPTANAHNANTTTAITPSAPAAPISSPSSSANTSTASAVSATHAHAHGGGGGGGGGNNSSGSSTNSSFHSTHRASVVSATAHNLSIYPSPPAPSQSAAAAALSSSSSPSTSTSTSWLSINKAYSAPELRPGVSCDMRRADTYSFGVLLVELFTAQAPDALQHVIHAASISFQPVRDLALRCMKENPGARPVMANVLTELLIMRAESAYQQSPVRRRVVRLDGQVVVVV